MNVDFEAQKEPICIPVGFSMEDNVEARRESEQDGVLCATYMELFKWRMWSLDDYSWICLIDQVSVVIMVFILDFQVIDSGH